MKHIKLFESFEDSEMDSEMDSKMSNLSLIVASGDWRGITKTGQPDQWMFPAKITVDYYEEPKDHQIEDAFDQSGLRHFEDLEPYNNAEEIVEEIFGGDQNGSNLYQHQPFYLLVDSGVSPLKIKEELETVLNDYYNSDGQLEFDYCETILEDPSEMSKYTPEFIEHCQSVVDGEESSMMRDVDFAIITM